MRRAAVLAALAVAVACGVNNHLLEGQLYDAQGACLGPAGVVDDLSGPDPGSNCPAHCIVASSSGQTSVFITTTCPPYPGPYGSEIADAARDATDPCVGAFAAYADGAICTGAIAEGGAGDASDAAEAGDAGDAGTDGASASDAPADAALEASASDGAADGGDGE